MGFKSLAEGSRSSRIKPFQENYTIFLRDKAALSLYKLMNVFDVDLGQKI